MMVLGPRNKLRIGSPRVTQRQPNRVWTLSYHRGRDGGQLICDVADCEPRLSFSPRHRTGVEPLAGARVIDSGRGSTPRPRIPRRFESRALSTDARHGGVHLVRSSSRARTACESLFTPGLVCSSRFRSPDPSVSAVVLSSAVAAAEGPRGPGRGRDPTAPWRRGAGSRPPPTLTKAPVQGSCPRRSPTFGPRAGLHGSWVGRV